MERVEDLDDAKLIELAQRIAPQARPLAYYPGWRFSMEEVSAPDDRLRMRFAIWQECQRRDLCQAIEFRWIHGLKLRTWLGHDHSRLLFVSGSFDPNELTFISEHLKPGMIFVDAGAHEGIYSLLASRLVGQEGHVLSLEPSRREREALVKNIDLNAARNVEVLPIALSDHMGEAELRVAERAHSGHNTLGEFAHVVGQASSETVQVATLDSVLKEHGLNRLHFLKIDTEGAELKILRGARRSIEAFRPVIQFEVNETALRAQQSSPVELIEFVGSIGYRCYEFSSQTGQPVPMVEIHDGTNLLALPVE
jgi:FkbM family methyltransferase